ncbi:PucR family transcriptional regulator [Nonomuraea spiralis]|uniref:PucR family transcriptional regulator n=1 Tax=Nonomuraea spiralis TaxID=46182 RepID=A0ABV5I9W5_9ACTN|nr:helix-turn-helix domain-containing protein [Nonomuraea spiralis]GGT05886.1 DNA-binding protein [Nonomuraea spiralis]
MSAQGRVTLGVLLDSLGAEAVTALCLPSGRQAMVGAPVIHGSDEPMTAFAGALLLATGRPEPSLLEDAAGAGVSAVVVRAGLGNAAALTEAARDAGVALLAAAPGLAWGQLYALVDALLALVAPAADLGGGVQAGDLFALANQVAQRVGGAVAIEDLAMRVLAYSTIGGQPIDELRREGILGRRVPEHPTNAEEYAAVLRCEQAVWSYQPREYLPRLAIAVRARGEALGTIWAIQADEPLAPDAPAVLAEAARTAAPHLARISLAADKARRTRDEWLGWLLRGVGHVGELAASFGLHPEEPVTVVAVGTREVGGRTDAFAATHAADLLRTAYAAYRIRAAVGAVDGRTYAVVAAGAGTPLLRRITADTLTQITDRLGGRWRAGVGRTAPTVAQAPASARQADDALRAMCGPFGGGEVGLHEELAAALFLLDAGASMRASPAPAGEPLSLVAEHDAGHGTDYVHSLRVWLAAHYDVPRAAETLSLHPNTLRYRLRRIGELIPLDDPDVRLVLGLQLRLAEIRASGTNSGG